ncbi:hypothetical protein ZTR_05818 [Talaromyces verruculosus]|nr:hypothetical protein ZTR_05818 [Talaromyces verruculosus]
MIEIEEYTLSQISSQYASNRTPTTISLEKVYGYGRSPRVPSPETGEICTSSLRIMQDPKGQMQRIISPQLTPPDLELSVLRVNETCDQIQQLMGRFVDSHRNGGSLQRKRSKPSENAPSKARVPTDFRSTLDHTRHLLMVRGSPSPPDFKNVSYHPPLVGDQIDSPDALIALLEAARPILQLGYEKITHLHTVFKQEIYPLHPCIRLQLSQDIIDTLFSLLARGPYSATYDLDVIDVEIMKAVVAIALMAEGDTQVPLASDLESHLSWSVDSCYDQEHPQVEDIIMATLLDLISQPQSARTLVTFALEGVDITLEMMNNSDGKTSPLLLPSAFKFLLSSLSSMLLVVSHYPTQYRQLCSKPFHAAIDMLNNNMQGVVKDPSIDICGAIQELLEIAEIIRLPPPERLAAGLPLGDAKEGEDNISHLGQAFAGPNMFDELQTPDSDFFSGLGNVNISAPELLYMNMNNMFD